MASSDPTPATKITRDDLQRQFATIQERIQGQVDDRKSTIKAVAGVGAVVLALVLFMLGRRSGKKKTTLVEIRRV
ncbi:hypothetical protein BH24ACT5_BH24ACT5_31260 [soil metagenome]